MFPQPPYIAQRPISVDIHEYSSPGQRWLATRRKISPLIFALAGGTQHYRKGLLKQENSYADVRSASVSYRILDGRRPGSEGGGRTRPGLGDLPRAYAYSHQPKNTFPRRGRAAETLRGIARPVYRDGGGGFGDQANQIGHRGLPDNRARSHRPGQADRIARRDLPRTPLSRNRCGMERGGDGKPRHAFEDAMAGYPRADPGNEANLEQRRCRISRPVCQFRSDLELAQTGPTRWSACAARFCQPQINRARDGFLRRLVSSGVLIRSGILPVGHNYFAGMGLARRTASRRCASHGAAWRRGERRPGEAASRGGFHASAVQHLSRSGRQDTVAARPLRETGRDTQKRIRLKPPHGALDG